MTAPSRAFRAFRDTGLVTEDDALVRRFLAQRAGAAPVEAVVLFGSRARGDATPASDVRSSARPSGPVAARRLKL